MQRELTVSQLNRYIDGVFEDERVLHDIKVLGEVSEFKRTASGRSSRSVTRNARFPAFAFVRAMT